MSDDFTRNTSPPLVSPKLNTSLREIGGVTPSGLPVFRLIWGQAWEGEYAHTWTRYGEVAHRYRYRWDKTYAMAEPVYDLVGRFKGYGKLYYYGDVMPAGGLLVPVEMKKSIGIPRWYVEIAMPVDEEEWESERYDPPVPKGTRGEIVMQLLASSRIRDKNGPPPPGLVEYFPLSVAGMLMRFENHDRRRVRLGGEDVPACCAERVKAGKRCYGQGRNPTMQDVEMIRRAWAENQIPKPDFFAAPDGTRLAWANESAIKEHERQEAQRLAQYADDMKQAVSCLSESRFMGDGSGMDLAKYSTHYKQMPGTQFPAERKPNATSA